jgi:hypothetical protein
VVGYVAGGTVDVVVGGRVVGGLVVVGGRVVRVVFGVVVVGGLVVEVVVRTTPPITPPPACP